MLQVNETLSLSTQPIVLLLRGNECLVSFVLRPWVWLGVSWCRQLIFSTWLVALVHQYIDLLSGHGDIPSRYSALFMWLKRRTLRKTGEGVPLFGAGVWTLAQNGVWWADLKNIRLVWTTVTLFHCCRHANMWRLPSSAERLTDPTLP